MDDVRRGKKRQLAASVVCQEADIKDGKHWHWQDSM